MDRRRFLKSSAATGAGLLVASRVSETLVAGAATMDLAPFLHGVASGDPLPDRVIIWTRVTPTDDALPGTGKGDPVSVVWEVATDRRFRSIARAGEVVARAATDHTVKVDVTGLTPGRRYFYRFKAFGKRSRAGQMRTAPAPGTAADAVRFGLVSCSNYEGGYFSAYRHLAERNDLDFVLHLGDYIYEYGAGGYGPGSELGRTHRPEHEIVTLSDYRTRYGQYRQDADLQDLHATNAFITIWDDHEVTNDSYKDGAENHQPESEGDYIDRRNDAYKAYFEWMPIRQRRNPRRLYRSFRFGDLADLHMLDLRQYRDEQPANQADPSKDDPDRTITGDRQMEWFKKGLKGSTARWRLIGNQVMFIPFETAPDVPFNIDAWDGYRADRDELVRFMSDNAIDNVVFLTGDIHTSWASDVPLDKTTYPATPSVCTEFVCPSVTSDNLDDISGAPYRSSMPVEETIKADNRWVRYVELDSHGYCVVDANSERLQTDYYFISDRTDPDATQSFAAAWQTVAGSNSVTEAAEPIPEVR